MNNSENNASLLLLTGGEYHDFGTFASCASGLFGEVGFEVVHTEDTTMLMHLAASDHALAVIFTCYVEPPEEGRQGLQFTEGISDGETEALAAWVRGGGGLVAVHSATTIRPDNERLKKLYGGRFISHPPRCPVNVCRMAQDHPTTTGVAPFVVIDELYLQEYEDDVRIHMAAVDRGVVYPMAWTRAEGRGRVAHVTPGHDEAVWRNPAYRRLLQQSAVWASGREVVGIEAEVDRDW